MGQKVGPVRIERDEVNAADYNENGTLDANATRAKMAKVLKMIQVDKMGKVAIMAKMSNQVVSKAERRSAFDSR